MGSGTSKPPAKIEGLERRTSYDPKIMKFETTVERMDDYDLNTEVTSLDGNDNNKIRKFETTVGRMNNYDLNTEVSSLDGNNNFDTKISNNKPPDYSIDANDEAKSPVEIFESELFRAGGDVNDAWRGRLVQVGRKASSGVADGKECRGYWETVGVHYMRYWTENGSWKHVPVSKTNTPAKESVVIPLQKLCVEQIRILGQVQSYVSEKSFEALYKLCRLSDTGEISLGDVLVKEGFQRAFETMWDSLHAAMTMDIAWDHNNTKEYLALSLLKEAIIAFSKASPTMCAEIGAKVIPILADEFSLQVYRSGVLNTGETKLLWNSYRESLKRTMIILYYLVRNCPKHKRVLRDTEYVELLQSYLKSRFMIIRARALFLLVSIVNEDESERLNIGNMSVEFLVRILRKTLAEKDHVSRHYSFSACEVVDGISALAVNDNNKLKFTQVSSGDALSLLQQILETSSDYEEQYSAAKALWMFSFHPDNKSVIRDYPKMAATLERYGTRLDNHDDLSKACKGVMWEIGLTSENKAQTAAKDNKTHADEMQHVMISYQWDVQPLMIRIKDLLKQHGFKVWIDIECMGGSTLEAMAKAVEESAVVLICLTDKYKESPSTRTEAEYTYKLRKPYIPLRMQQGYDADGWLGVMVGTKLWIDLSSVAKINSNMGALEKEIGSRGKLLELDDSYAAGMESTKSVVPALRNSNKDSTGNHRLERTAIIHQQRVVCSKEVSTWSQDDVMNWLHKCGLETYKAAFNGYDGQRLLGLKSISAEAPDFFYNALKSDMKFKNLLDIVKFKQAIDDIL